MKSNQKFGSSALSHPLRWAFIEAGGSCPRPLRAFHMFPPQSCACAGSAALAQSTLPVKSGGDRILWGRDSTPVITQSVKTCYKNVVRTSGARMNQFALLSRSWRLSLGTSASIDGAFSLMRRPGPRSDFSEIKKTLKLLRSSPSIPSDLPLRKVAVSHMHIIFTIHEKLSGTEYCISHTSWTPAKISTLNQTSFTEVHERMLKMV
jgi:hypothetical protein